MVVITRTRKAPAEPATPDVCGHAADLAVIARVLARVIVRTAPGSQPASFRHLAVACGCSHAEIEVIDRLAAGG